jgi:ribosome-associated protein
LTFAPNATLVWGAGDAAGGSRAGRVRERCETVARAASSKLGRGTVVLGVDRLFGLADAFVITSGSNPRQVRTICDEIERQVKLAGGGGPAFVEGLGDASWVLMDYGDFVVHVFLDEVRRFYDLEGLWGDAEQWTWDDEAETLQIVGVRQA